MIRKSHAFGFLLGILAVIVIAATPGVRGPHYDQSGYNFVQTGTNITAANGTCTNTFATVFGSAPNVVASQVGGASASNEVSLITTSNFVYTAGASSIGVQYIAVGSP